MASFPQRGGCLCGEVEYELAEEPLTVYACHCRDCQRQGGSAFSLSAVVRSDALRLLRGEPGEYSIRMRDGRVKSARFCTRCCTRLFNPSGRPGLTVLEGGTLHDPARLRPAGHIWTRSRQPWVEIPEGDLRYERQPAPDEWLELVRLWKERASA